MADKILEVKDLQVSFKTQGGILKAVRGISFDLHKGETLAIVGESGSGKSVTSKAIIGILAGNSIVEGGEIIYDGQDLLKIDEERFHKIRGDKISMIFQDPLSSLNPIMRVGQQITEAMILNGIARQKNARKNFNTYLKKLDEIMDKADPTGKEYNDEACKTFDKFCVIAAKDEKAYDDAFNAAVALQSSIEETAFLITKRQPVNLSAFVKKFSKSYLACLHEYVLVANDNINALYQKIIGLKDAGYNHNNPELNIGQIVEPLYAFVEVLKAAQAKEHPNFFRMGYYKLMNPEDTNNGMSVEDIDERNLNYLNDRFMNAFIEEGAKAISLTNEIACGRKSDLKKEIAEFRDLIAETDNLLVIRKELNEGYKKINVLIQQAIDPLETNKNTVEYSFGVSFKHEIKRYFQGLRINPRNQRKYERSKAAFDKLVASGKAPTWQVIPPYLVDLELCKANMVSILNSLITCYEKQIARKINPTEQMINLIDFFKEQCSRFVYTVTPSLARAKAMDLLKEVGFTEPALRFRQYPFEFSGGMRQRVVIAIALSANPDILICDEPTTALDVTIQSQILELINKIKEERNLSVIFITHDLGVVANMADKIAVMYAGKIVETGTADDIFYDPRHPYTWALLSSMPDLDTKEKLEAIPGTPPNMIYPPKGDAFAERNKYALDIDYEIEPPLFEISPTHYAATWLLHPNAPKVEIPQIIRDRIKRMQEKEGK